MTDMLVKLYSKRNPDNREALEQGGIVFRRALAIDKQIIVDFVAEQFNDICPGWVDECVASLYRHPTSCFIAIKDKSVIGFICYDGTAKGMIGPLGVHASYRKGGIATVLLNQCFEAMKMDGYAYAIIGWVSSTEFYEKSCGAIEIPDSFPGVYSRMVLNT